MERPGGLNRKVEERRGPKLEFRPGTTWPNIPCKRQWNLLTLGLNCSSVPNLL